ncbi:hypothetical protein NB706_003248 [Xanthomonas sacchari]|nr:hypothetical protein [Xanthomonas sacchari]
MYHSKVRSYCQASNGRSDGLPPLAVRISPLELKVSLDDRSVRSGRVMTLAAELRSTMSSRTSQAALNEGRALL